MFTIEIKTKLPRFEFRKATQIRKDKRFLSRTKNKVKLKNEIFHN